MSAASSPALIIHFPTGTTLEARDRLATLLADFDLVAIQENDVNAPTAWTAHFGSGESRHLAAQAIADAEGPELRTEAVEVEDEDWARRTQADLPAIRVGRVIIAPPWDMPGPEQAAGAIVVEIEPSCGFGTGHHQSTRLCLVLLQSRTLDSLTVIDVGTGSGVLAIVAARLGAPFVRAIDVDPDAVDNARENIARNGVGGQVEAHVRDFTEGTMDGADVVTANLTGTLLARHGDALGALVRPGGSVIVAGFTVDEKPLVLDAFGERFTLSQSAEEDDWWALVMTKA